MQEEVHQGKNTGNIEITDDIWLLPTIQKAVENLVIQSSIGNDPDEMRRLLMDNRYSAVLQFVLLCER